MTEEIKNEEGTKEVVVPTQFKDLIEKIEKMTVVELAELVKVLEDKFGVSASAPVMMMAGGDAGAGAAAEKSAFDVVLSATGDNKIGVIKVVKELTNLGLKEAKDLVDGAPSNILTGAKKEDAETAKKKLEEAGATVELK